MSMTLEAIRATLPPWASDIALNLGSVLSAPGAPGLTKRQIWAVALASAISARNPGFARDIEQLARAHLDEAHVTAARAAAAIMGMNNIYYRFLHLVEDPEYRTLPARLRMNVIGRPGIDKLDFELLSLAVSVVNGCGACIVAHERKLREHGVPREAVQSAVRIAATLHAAAGALEYSGAVAEAGAHPAPTSAAPSAAAA